jgi:hypothetical protein
MLSFSFEKQTAKRAVCFCSFVYKPGSVLNGHQSARFVTETLRENSRATSEHMPDKHSMGCCFG